MVNTKGVRRGTRHLFKRGFKENGTIPHSVYMRTYKIGDFVNIKANGAIHKGMPHKYYHGKTGRVANVTKRGVGVIVNKRVRWRIIPKRINIRVEHVKPSKCREDFLRRVKENDNLKRAAREKGQRVELKRKPARPASAHFVKAKYTEIQDVRPIPYKFVC